MTYIPWRQDSCSSKSRSKSVEFVWLVLWFISLLLFGSATLCQWGRIILQHFLLPARKYTLEHFASPNCHVLLSCSAFLTLLSSPKEIKDSSHVSKSLKLSDVSLRELFSNLIQKSWTNTLLAFPHAPFPPQLDVPFFRWKWLSSYLGLLLAVCKRVTSSLIINWESTEKRNDFWFLPFSPLLSTWRCGRHLASVLVLFSYCQRKTTMTH